MLKTALIFIATLTIAAMACGGGSDEPEPTVEPVSMASEPAPTSTSMPQCGLVGSSERVRPGPDVGARHSVRPGPDRRAERPRAGPDVRPRPARVRRRIRRNRRRRRLPPAVG